MKHLKFFFAALLAVCIAGCNSVSGLKNFAECKIDFKSVSNVKLADVDLKDVKGYKDLKMADALALLTAYSQKNLMLNMDVNLSVKNPNDEKASLDGLDYILWIDDQEMLDGTIDQKVTIEGKQTSIVSLPISMNLYDAIKDKKLQPMAELALSLASDQAESSRVKVSVKPFFTIGGKEIRFPTFITIGGDQIMPKRKDAKE